MERLELAPWGLVCENSVEGVNAPAVGEGERSGVNAVAAREMEVSERK
jgi:hypothetical protein